MGQLLSIDTIISLIEIKSSDDMKIYPLRKTISFNVNCQKYNPDKIYFNREYKMNCILNVELIEEQILEE